MANVDKTTQVIENKDRSTDYSLHYKSVHNVGNLYFKGPTDIKDAITAGKTFCDARKWRFIQVRPMFTDIDSTPQSEEERAKYMEKA